MTNFYTGGGSRTSSQLVGTTDFLIEVAKGTVLGHSFVQKYGRNSDIDTATDPEDIWEYGGTYTFPTVAAINYISSSDNTDTQQITVQGLDADYNFQSITVDLVGQTKTQIGTEETWIRIFRAFNSDSTEFAGQVYVYEDDTVSGGIPQTASKVKATILAANQQTYMAIYTVPAGKTAYLLQKAYSMNDNNANTRALIDLRIREFGGVFRSKELDAIRNEGTSLYQATFSTPLTIPEKSDILIQCRETSTNDTDITAYFNLLLVDN